MTINQVCRSVGTGLLALTLASAVADAKCGGHAGHVGHHGIASFSQQTNLGGSSPVAAVEPEPSETRSAFIDDSPFILPNLAGATYSAPKPDGGSDDIGGPHRK